MTTPTTPTGQAPTTTPNTDTQSKIGAKFYNSLVVSYTNILIGKRAIGTYKGFMGDIMGDIPNYLYL